MADYKSKLRKKFELRRNESDGGRSLGAGYGDRTVESQYGKKKVAVPKTRGAGFSDKLQAALKRALQSRAREVLGSNKKTTSEKEVAKGLTGIRHPAQLIPAIQKGRTISGIINAFTKK